MDLDDRYLEDGTCLEAETPEWFADVAREWEESGGEYLGWALSSLFQAYGTSLGIDWPTASLAHVREVMEAQCHTKAVA